MAARGARAAERPSSADRHPDGWSENEGYRSWIAVFVQRLAQLGWADSRNVQIDIRWTNGDINQARKLAKELVALQPDAILAATTPVTAALQRETSTIPIVFVVVSDPVGAGFVASLPRPGGNITGFINTEAAMGGKWLELLKEIAPRLRRVALMSTRTPHPAADHLSGLVRGRRPIIGRRLDHGPCP